MSSVKYSINFTGCKLGYLVHKDDKYEGKIVLEMEDMVGEIITKPQTREWWIETAEKVGGEFKKQVKLFL